MKKVMFMIADVGLVMRLTIALIMIFVASSVFAQSRRFSSLFPLSERLKIVDLESYNIIPDEYRSSVEDEIGYKAHTAALSEAVLKFNIEIFPESWTNNCMRGFIYKDDFNGYYFKCDKDGRLVQFGTDKEFEELIWYEKRKNELVVEFFRDQAIVNVAITNAIQKGSVKVFHRSESFSQRNLLSRQAKAKQMIVNEMKNQIIEQPKVTDAKIDAFLKDYLGVQFGDSIDKFEKTNGISDNIREIPVLKKYKHFDKARGQFAGGKLFRLTFYCMIDKKFSENSVDIEMGKNLADMAVLLGLERDFFKRDGYLLNRRGKIADATNYSLKPFSYSRARDSYMWRGVDIVDDRIRKLAIAREKSSGEVFPEVK